MIPNIATIAFPDLQYGPLIITIVATLTMLALCVRPSKRPRITGLLCLTAGFLGIATSSFLFATRGRIALNATFFILYALYNIFIIVPVLVSMHRLAKARIDTLLISLGYLWSFVVLACSIVLAALEHTVRDSLNPSFAHDNIDKALAVQSVYNHTASFLFDTNMGFVVISLVLLVTFYRSLAAEKSVLYAMISFSILITISAFMTIILRRINSTPNLDSSKKLAIVSIILVDLPNALAIVTWFVAYGHKKLRKNKANSLHSSFNNSQTEPEHLNNLPSTQS